MEYKNQTENRAFQEMLQAAVKRLQNRSGEEIEMCIRDRCTVKSPSENRGKGEAAHRERGEQRNPVSVCKGKTADGQLCIEFLF